MEAQRTAALAAITIAAASWIAVVIVRREPPVEPVAKPIEVVRLDCQPERDVLARALERLERQVPAAAARFSAAQTQAESDAGLAELARMRGERAVVEVRIAMTRANTRCDGDPFAAGAQLATQVGELDQHIARAFASRDHVRDRDAARRKLEELRRERAAMAARLQALRQREIERRRRLLWPMHRRPNPCVDNPLACL